MFLRRFLFISVLLASSVAATAGGIDLNVRDEAVQLQYATSTPTATQVHVGFLNTKDHDWLADWGLIVRGPLNFARMRAGVGLKAVGARLDHEEIAAIALGGELRLPLLPLSDRLALVARVYAAPNVITYGDGTRYLESGARLEYELIPDATVYIGYRRMTFDLETRSDAVLDSGFHAGLRLSF